MDGKNAVVFMKLYIYFQNNLVNATELSALLPQFMQSVICTINFNR